MALDGDAATFEQKLASHDIFQILSSDAKPNAIKDQVALYMQRSGLGGGFIKRSDFGRLNTEEEIARKRKMSEAEHLAYMARLRNFRDNLNDTRRDISDATDEANELINHLLKLVAAGAVSAGALEQIYRYRNLLRNYGIAIDNLILNAAGMPSPDDLDILESAFADIYGAFRDNREEIMQTFSNAYNLIKTVSGHAKDVLEDVFDVVSEKVSDMVARII